jgi:hypothetical protein
MSKGLCNDNERRISDQETSGVITLQQMIGAKCYIRSVSAMNGWRWDENAIGKEYTVKEIGFRISVDGKCFTIVVLDGIDDRIFTLKDLEFVELGDD